ncbi:hypothetical protein BC833DRAFT_579947 [Globomyces pollinis-pini]|nr:hypothetical protein BC833DRAFT_579947 [Globomyces pollinis-pini]KAJ3000545.1 hypothetical protein HDV02_004840 [Globomyces sp. JEL0801]
MQTDSHLVNHQSDKTDGFVDDPTAPRTVHPRLTKGFSQSEGSPAPPSPLTKPLRSMRQNSNLKNESQCNTASAPNLNKLELEKTPSSEQFILPTKLGISTFVSDTGLDNNDCAYLPPTVSKDSPINMGDTFDIPYKPTAPLENSYTIPLSGGSLKTDLENPQDVEKAQNFNDNSKSPTASKTALDTSGDQKRGNFHQGRKGIMSFLKKKEKPEEATDDSKKRRSMFFTTKSHSSNVLAVDTSKPAIEISHPSPIVISTPMNLIKQPNSYAPMTPITPSTPSRVSTNGRPPTAILKDGISLNSTPHPQVIRTPSNINRAQSGNEEPKIEKVTKIASKAELTLRVESLEQQVKDMKSLVDKLIIDNANLQKLLNQ